MPKTLDFHTSRFTITDGWLVDLLSGSVTATQASTAAPGSSAVGDVAAEGSATSLARSDHRHGREGFAAPGSSAVGDVAAAGVATTVPRSDHTHGREAFGAATGTAANAGSDGAATTLARSDHGHAIASGITPTVGVLDPPTANGQVTAAAVCKGWARVVVTTGTPALDADYNVSGITDNGVGRFNIQWDRDFTGASYVVTAVARGAVAEAGATGSASADLNTNDYAGAALDPSVAHITAYGILI